MSTIKSSNEHLTLNADGSSKDIKFQANGVEKASISSAGAFTSTTIDATALTGDLPAISGANLTGVGVDGISSSADATAITITSAEDVGIGTSSPSKTLSVHSTSGSAGTPNGLYLYNEVHGSDSQIYMYGENDSGAIQGTNIKLDPDAETFSLIGTGNQTAISIDNSGRVTMPLQPSFHVNGGPSKDGSNNLHSFGNVIHNIGSHYVNSNGRFTAPVAGRYLFNAGIYAVAGSNNMVSVSVNGGGSWASAHVFNESGQTSSGTFSVVLNLAASDYVTVICDYSIQGSTPRNFFSGHLLG